MFNTLGTWLWAQIRAIKPSFISKNPHFNFISAHYVWILAMSIVASVLIYGGGKGNLPYIDALFFGSGANTQAGLNTVDLNKLNTFQQAVIYVFPMLSGPITLHGSVVFLRLYWFEKRFQHIVREARHRRATLSRTKSKGDLSRAERGVGGRVITVLRETGNRITNDGMIIAPKPAGPETSGALADSSTDSTQPKDAEEGGSSERGSDSDQATGTGTEPHQNTISFAPTVTRSDGALAQLTKFPDEADDDMPALERIRDTRDEVLRIPNPRDVERGMGPKRLEAGDDADGDDVEPIPSRDGDNQQQEDPAEVLRRRNPTIVIQEPARRQGTSREHDHLDGIGEEVTAMKHTLGPLKFRKPRIFRSDDKVNHHDADKSSQPTRSKTIERVRSALAREKVNDMPYLSYTPTLGRNSQFHNLTLEQREELGGIEYRSLRTLALMLVCYFWGLQLFGLLCMLPYILTNDKYGKVVDEAATTRTWWAFWTSNMLFMDVGLSLVPESMIPFQRSSFILMIGSFLIIVGNTGFPIFLRCIIWVMSKIVPRGTGLWEELMFLLDHPRRCFTLLFPSSATWWLFFVLVVLNVVDVVSFLVLDIHNPVVEDLPWNIRVVDGIFQASSTRTAGFSCLPVNLIHPAVQTLTMIMMYISVYPIAISIRGTNVYEEKSLGIYNDPDDDDGGEQALSNDTASYIGTHLRRQLSFDLWFVFLGLFILAITEGGKLARKEFNMFDVLFEVVSAYGTVGMSMGYPGVDASLVSQFSTGGKLVIIAMMIRGRHRGLPYGLDRAILLPSESRLASEHAESGGGGPAPPPMDRTATRTSAASGVSTGVSRTVTRRTSNSAVPRAERPSTNFISQILQPGPTLPPRIHRTRTGELRRAASWGIGEGADEGDGGGPPIERARTGDVGGGSLEVEGETPVQRTMTTGDVREM